MGQNLFPIGAAPATPATNYNTVYAKTDKTMAYKDDTGTEYVLASKADVSAAGIVSVRQTVLQAPVDTSGFPTFLASTYASLVVTTQNVSTGVNSLVMTAAQGSSVTGAVNYVGQSTSNLTWPGCTASNTNYLPVLVSGGILTPQTPVTLVPIYQWGGTPSVTTGQYTFNIQQMTMYLGNGTSAPAVNHVIVGEVVAGASTITSTIAYALNRRYTGAWVNTLPASTTVISVNHNLGFIPKSARIEVLNLTTEHGVSVGEVLEPYTAPSASMAPFVLKRSRNSVQCIVGANTGYPFAINSFLSGGNVALTPANWAYRIISEGW